MIETSAPALDERSGEVHLWQPASGAWRELLASRDVDALVEAHRGVLISLGYDPDDRAR